MFFKLLIRNPQAVIGMSIMAFFIVISLAAPIIAPYDPEARVGLPHEAPSSEHLFGTSRMGRDVFSQVLYAGQISITVGITAGLITTFIALATGLSAGYFGGRIDEVITFATNVILVLPQLPLLLVLAAFLGEVSPALIAFIIGVTSWAWGSRVIRSQTLALREKEFIKAAELIGEPARRIIFIELLPNLISIIGSGFIGAVIYAVMTQATLEFIGLGDPTSISWGTMLYHAQTSSAIYVGAWWDLLVPCVAISLFGASLALLNFAVDEVANPKLRAKGALRRYKRMLKRGEVKA
ncbi:ABC transporter permease [Salinibius halmophilus]|uniref:ABC transporter permease n=1 Tax=Salinibius halmophilus TaxID=1853216 RepID=UPI000E670BA4|nr:ABC transporter permease [Salinibius halmophilus]